MSEVIVHWHECRKAELPADNTWLADRELTVLRSFRVPKRRDDWRLGRWTAKQAVAAYLRMPAAPQSLAAIEIRPADSGAPEVFLPDGPAPISISISHCQGMAVCGVTSAGIALGCDLETIELRSDEFIQDYFLETERALLARAPERDRSWLATLLWSAKESALKALREGLRLDTRSVEVQLDLSSAGEWRPLTVRAENQRCFHGWWGRDDSTVRTLVSDLPAEVQRSAKSAPGLATHPYCQANERFW